MSKLKPLESIKSHKEIRQLLATGKRFTCDGITVIHTVNSLTHSRLVLAIKKKVGGAVVRNRIKRQIKELMRTHQLQFSNNYDFLILVNPNQAIYYYESLKNTLMQILKKQAIIKIVNTEDWHPTNTSEITITNEEKE